MTIIDINQYKQELEDALNDALNTSDHVIKLLEINKDLDEMGVWLEYARQALYPPLRCIRGGRQ